MSRDSIFRGMETRSKNAVAFGAIIWSAAGTLLQAWDIYNLIPSISPGWVYMFFLGCMAGGFYQLVASFFGWRAAVSKAKEDDLRFNEQRLASIQAEQFAMGFDVAIEDLFRMICETKGNKSLKEIEAYIRLGKLRVYGLHTDRIIREVIPTVFWTRDACLCITEDIYRFSLVIKDTPKGHPKYKDLLVRKDDMKYCWPELA